jgi:predicted DNA-binding ribbon-helix-helix protein
MTMRYGNLSSIRMEPVFFYALRLIAICQGLSMADLIRNIEAQPRYSTQSLTSALRCYALREIMALYFDSTRPTGLEETERRPKRSGGRITNTPCLRAGKPPVRAV